MGLAGTKCGQCYEETHDSPDAGEDVPRTGSIIDLEYGQSEVCH